MLSQRYIDVGPKLRKLHGEAEWAGLKINVAKGIKINFNVEAKLTEHCRESEQVESFLYLDSIITTTG